LEGIRGEIYKVDSELGGGKGEKPKLFFTNKKKLNIKKITCTGFFSILF